MDSAFGLLAIIISGIAVLATVIYLILKAASYFKRTFGIPAAVLACSCTDYPSDDCYCRIICQKQCYLQSRAHS